MDKLTAFGIILCTSIFGLIRIICGLKNINNKHDFAIEFIKKLKEYINSSGRDYQAYTYLINRSNKMQSNMGAQGIIHNYRPPYQNFMFNSYPIILNMIPDLRQALEDDILSSRLSGQYAGALQEALVRHIGELEDAINGQKDELKNPIIWVREGVRGVTALPAYLFEWLGLISEATAYRIQGSFIFRILTGFLATIGFLSAVITIVLGWDPFVASVKKLFS